MPNTQTAQSSTLIFFASQEQLSWAILIDASSLA